MWGELPKHWQRCFEQVWESYKNGSFPIGAVITDEKDNIIATGRNKVYENQCHSNEICNNKIAHAEINAILKINNLETNEARRHYKIYSSMEPCPLCFGAITMSGIRNIHYAARDSLAGATNLQKGNDHLRQKNFNIKGPHPLLEMVQFVIITDFILRRGHDVVRIIQPWKQDCPIAIEIASEWFNEDKLLQAGKNDVTAKDIIDEIFQEISRRTFE
jgi:tRNA(adenine34) deaminase